MNFFGLIIPRTVLIVRNLQDNLTIGSYVLSKNQIGLLIDYRSQTVNIADNLIKLSLHVVNQNKIGNLLTL